MEMTFIKLYSDLIDTMDDMTDEEAGRLVKALLRFSSTGEDVPPTGAERYVYRMIISQFKREVLSQEKSSEQSRENGRKGGRPKKNQETENPAGYLGFSENPQVIQVSEKTQKTQQVIQVSEKTQKTHNKEDKDREDNNTPPNPLTGDQTAATGLITSSEAESIQAEQEQIFAAVDQAGLKPTNAIMDRLIGFYTDYGKEAVLFAISEAVDNCKGGITIQYIRKVLEKGASPHKKQSKPPSDDDDWGLSGYQYI